MIETKEEFDEHQRMLKSDLHSLFKLVFAYRKPIAEGDIRLASVILRKWLVGGLLGHFCNVARIKPTLFALDTEEVCSAVAAHPNIDYFITAGIRFEGRLIQGIYNANIPSTGIPLVQLDGMKKKEFTLREFLEQNRLYFEGAFFSTEDIIKFTANKLGGAHLDFARPGTFAQLERAASFMTYGGPPVPQGAEPPSPIYLILEPKSTEVLTGLHLEIIAAASSFVQIQFDGEAFFPLEVRRTARSLARSLVGRKKGRYHFYDDRR